MQPGRIFLTENLRFDPREEKNARSFAKELALLGDIYVNDAFSVSHRKHASVCAITKYLPSYAGELLNEEVTQLEKSLAHPFVLVLGGVKLETKMGFLQSLGREADSILIGGGIGVVLEAIRSDRLKLAEHLKPTSQELRAGKKILRSLSNKLILPSDVILKSDGKASNVHELTMGDVIVDIGPKSQRAFQKIIESSASAVWNGPMGMLEDSRARLGTQAILRALVHAKGRTIAGGGDTLQMLDETGLGKKLSFVSTGGGAMLAFLAGEPMPGLKPLIK
jgi:phosphoglycerate kinase